MASRPEQLSSQNASSLKLQATIEPSTHVPLAIIWGFSEATLFFLVPDILITWVALRRGRASAVTLAYVVVGSLLGGRILAAQRNRFEHRRDTVSPDPTT